MLYSEVENPFLRLENLFLIVMDYDHGFTIIYYKIVDVVVCLAQINEWFWRRLEFKVLRWDFKQSKIYRLQMDSAVRFYTCDDESQNVKSWNKRYQC